MEIIKRWKDDLWDPMNGFERLRDESDRLSDFGSFSKTQKNRGDRKKTFVPKKKGQRRRKET